jgi:peptidoglycan/xylan/chitin deacetylase (PgdA/CDA1 family)
VQKKPFRFLPHLIKFLGNGLRRLDQEGRICIITYHRVLEHQDPLLDSEPDIKTFTWQMEVLASSFNVLTLSDAIVAIKENKVPPRAICITFDDGYRSCHDLALPILSRLGLPATVFVTTGFLDGGNMWNDRIIEALREAPMGSLDLREIGLGLHRITTSLERKEIAQKINDESKYLPKDKRTKVVETIEKLTGNTQVKNLMLTREMIVNLSNNGIEIGGHTITHPILTTIDNSDALREITDNKHVLEKIIGKPIHLFAYPNGKIGTDFDLRHLKMVKDAGYHAAFSTAFGTAANGCDFFQIPRSRPWDRTPFIFSMRLLFWLGTQFKQKDHACTHFGNNKCH